MKDEIKLNSRYGVANKLIKVGERSYKLKTPHNYRAGLTEENKTFIDPSGGPMMVEGEFLPEANAFIESIKEGIITFKE